MTAKIAYQLYSARLEAEKDLKSLLLSLKQIGYEAVEFAGFFDFSSTEILSFLKEAELEAISSHVPLTELRERLDSVIRFHKEIGCKRIVIPYLEEKDRPPRESFEAFVEFAKKLQAELSKEGIELYYHNHDFEFVQHGGVFALDYLYDKVPNLKCELDTCWIKFALQNPIDYLNKYKGRYDIVHLKDFICDDFSSSPYKLLNSDKNDAAKSSNFKFMPFGYGIQDCMSLVKASVLNGTEYLIVEQDEAYDTPNLKAAEMSYNTIKDILNIL